MYNKIKEVRFDLKNAQSFFTEAMAYTLGPVELKSLMDEDRIQIADVRRVEDYVIAHIPGAISMPIDELSNNLDKLSKETVTVVYCYNQQCHLGLRGCLKLAEYGYPVMHLDGGFKTWSEDFRFVTLGGEN